MISTGLSTLRYLPRVLRIVGLGITLGIVYSLARLVRRPVRRSQYLRRFLSGCGATGIRIGQMLAMRYDFFDDELCRDLTPLLDDAAPIPKRAVIKLITRELRASPGEVFASFEDTPFAVGSLGQAHRATVADGRSVIVKVQRPGVAATIAADVRLLRLVATYFDLLRPLSPLRLVPLVNDLEKTLLRELDYVDTGYTLDMLRRTSKRLPLIVVPRIVRSHSSQRVLTVEAIAGTPLSRYLDRAHARAGDRAPVVDGGPPPEVLRTAAAAIASFVLYQMLENGHFHTFVHAGNFLLLEDGRVAVIDYDISGFLGETERARLTALLRALCDRDVDRVSRGMFEIFDTTAEVQFTDFEDDSRRAVTLWLTQALDPEAPLSRRGVGRLLFDIIALVHRHRLQAPQLSRACLQALASTDIVLARLAPGFDSVTALAAYFETQKQRRSPEAFVAGTRAAADSYVRLVEALPSSLARVASTYLMSQRRGVSFLLSASRLVRFASEVAGLGAIVVAAWQPAAQYFHLAGGWRWAVAAGGVVIAWWGFVNSLRLADRRAPYA